MVTSDGETRGTRIRSVTRASQLLLLLARRREGATAAQAARELGLTVSTTHHLLNTLAEEELATKHAGARYVLGPRIAVLADGFVGQAVPEYLHAPLRELAASTGETAYLATWKGTDIRVLASVEGAGAVRVAEVERGPYRHAHARATGKLLLAFARSDVRAAYLAGHPPVALTPHTIVAPDELEAEFARIRARGHSEDLEEFVEGVSCVSAPYLLDGVVVAAYTVSSPSQRYDRRRGELREAVQAAAAAAAAEPPSSSSAAPVRRSA